MHHVHAKDEFRVTTDRAALDIDVIHRFLTRSYWARGVPRDLVERSLLHSLCFGLFERESQIGFARLVTDRTHFAHLCDVFVLESHQGRGLGRWLMECVLAAPELEDMRTISLSTADAHEFYRRLGFREIQRPENQMQKLQDRAWFVPG
jgi:GNAT superfamily N-acetyltransferase